MRKIDLVIVFLETMEKEIIILSLLGRVPKNVSAKIDKMPDNAILILKVSGPSR